MKLSVTHEGRTYGARRQGNISTDIITAVSNNSRHVCKVVCAARVRCLVVDSEELLQLELLVDGVETQDLLLADGGANRQVQLETVKIVQWIWIHQDFAISP